MNREALSGPAKDELIALILAPAVGIARQTAHVEERTAQIAALSERVEERETKLGRPAQDAGKFVARAEPGRQAQPGGAARGEKEEEPRRVQGVGRDPRPDRCKAGRGLSAL